MRTPLKVIMAILPVYFLGKDAGFYVANILQ